MTDARGCLIGVDAGTTVYKGVLTDFDGAVLAEAEAPTSYVYPAPGRVECSAEQCAAPFRRVIRLLAQAAPSPVRAVALSGASGSLMTMDGDGEFGPMISWLDGRCVGAELPALAGLTAARLREISGWPCLDSFPTAELAWLRQNDPERLDRAAWIGLNTDYLQFLLSGCHAMDFSSGTTSHLIDQVGRDYSRELLARLGVRRGQLSRLVDPGTPIGRITAAAAREFGLPEQCLAVAGSFDHPSAALGAGVTEPGELLLSCGTSYVGFLPVARRADVLADPTLLCDPFRSAEGGAWGAIFAVTALGRRVDSLVRRFLVSDHPRPFAEFDRLAVAAAERGINPVLDLDREYDTAPLADREELALAIMNGAAAQLARRVDALRRRGMKLERGRLVGGLCHSPIFPSRIAAATGLTLECLDSNAGACGAARLAKKGYELR